MTSKLKLKPSDMHPISISPLGRRVVVKLADQVIASSDKALSLREAKYPEAIYIPRADVNLSLLERSAHSSYCPYKGDASYYSIPSGGDTTANSAWTYESPYESVAEIKDHLAFYQDRVEVIV